jgi:serine protease Do
VSPISPFIHHLGPHHLDLGTQCPGHPSHPVMQSRSTSLARSFTASWIALTIFLSLRLATSVALGQESSTTTANKLVTPSPSNQLSKSDAGSTYVSIDSELDWVARGGEPRTVTELQALEKQQEKVANQINAVTVNVQQGTAQGSGVIITPDGFVLTAAHVAGKPGRDATIMLSNGTKVKAKTLGTNRSMDAGLLKIIDKIGKPWPHASLGESAKLKPGQWVIAAGHPGGWMADRAAVIRVGRILQKMNSTLVTDCALIGGDSGGPLFDLNGRLVGIHSRIGTETADNMHVPIDVYRDSWDRLAASQAWGALPGFKPVIGVAGRKGENGEGPAEVGSVSPQGPADRIGILPGDIILSYDGVAIKSFNDLKRAVSESLPGDRVEVKWARQGTVLRRNIIVAVQEP